MEILEVTKWVGGLVYTRTIVTTECAVEAFLVIF